MFFQRVKTPGLGHNAYIVGCGEGLAVVIDPRRDVDEYLRIARENDLSIVYVLETHRQEDYEFGSRSLADMTGAKIVSGAHPLFGKTDVKLKDNQELKVAIHPIRRPRNAGTHTRKRYLRGLREGLWRQMLGRVHW